MLKYSYAYISFPFPLLVNLKKVHFSALYGLLYLWGQEMSPCKANTMTHPDVGLTPDATHRPKNWNERLRGREEVYVLRKRNCGRCCRSEANYCRCLKDLLRREFIESNLHVFSLKGLICEENCTIDVAIKSRTRESYEAFRGCTVGGRVSAGQRQEVPAGVSQSDENMTPPPKKKSWVLLYLKFRLKAACDTKTWTMSAVIKHDNRAWRVF